MRKTTLGVVLVAMVGCNKANFTSSNGKNPPAGASQVSPKTTDDPAVDPSQGPDGKATHPDGPTAGTGQPYEQVVELTCDAQSGGVIQVNGSGASLALADYGNPTTTPPDTGKPEPDLPTLPGGVVPAGANVTARVKGAFCPTATATLTVLFVVDFSGSMGHHVEPSTNSDEPGNDPQTAGNCGRLAAAQAVVTQLLADAKPGETLQIGMIPFAGDIVRSKVVKLMAASDFQAYLNKDTFCQYVIQAPRFGVDPQNPGGISGAGGIFGLGAVDASTNYKAAFQEAQSTLQRTYGRKAVYFISDGEPTSGGSDPTQAGIDAGAALRANVDNLTLNALLLGTGNATAQSVLEGVAGSADRVRSAASAAELAQQILTFPTPSLDPTSGHALVTVAPYAPKDLALASLAADPTRPAVWLYETAPFVLLGKAGETTENRVDVTAKGADGSTYQATVKIMFKP